MQTKEKTSGPGGNTEAIAKYVDIVTETTSCFHPIRHEVEVILASIIRDSGLTWRDIADIPSKHYPVSGPREVRDSIAELARDGTAIHERSVYMRLRKRDELRESACELGRIMGSQSEHGDPRIELARFRAYVAADAKTRRALELSWQTFTGPERRKRVQSLFGRLLARGEDPRLAAELAACWNDAHCDPPLEPQELGDALAAIARKERKRRGEAA